MHKNTKERKRERERILLRTHSAVQWRERESKNKRYKKSKAPFTRGNLAARLMSVSSAAKNRQV